MEVEDSSVLPASPSGAHVADVLQPSPAMQKMDMERGALQPEEEVEVHGLWQVLWRRAPWQPGCHPQQ